MAWLSSFKHAESAPGLASYHSGGLSLATVLQRGVMQVATNYRVRVSSFTGDAHMAGLFYTYTKQTPAVQPECDPGYIPSLVSSPLGVTPASSMLVTVFSYLTKFGAVPNIDDNHPVKGFADFPFANKRFVNVRQYMEVVEQDTGDLFVQWHFEQAQAGTFPTPADMSLFSQNISKLQPVTDPACSAGLEHAWVTSTEVQHGCDKACQELGPAWRYVNGGSDAHALCAGLIDMPGVGEQWLVGHTLSDHSMCYIQCATTPCWNLPAGASYEYDWVYAGADLTYTDANDELKFKQFPAKCACTTCQGLSCDAAFWQPAADSGSCPQPTIPPQVGEAFPSTVYSSICRSNEDGSYGYTGWVNTTSPATCSGMDMNVEDYSVWCSG